MAAASSNGSTWALPYRHAPQSARQSSDRPVPAMIAAARTCGSPATKPRRANTDSSQTGSRPMRRSSATPSSNEGLSNGLAGATMARTRTGASLRGRCITRIEPWRRSALVLVMPEDASQSRRGEWRGQRGREERSLVRVFARHRILDAPLEGTVLLRLLHDGFECCRLNVVVAGADGARRTPLQSPGPRGQAPTAPSRAPSFRDRR